MQSKKTWLIEISVVGLILIMLCGVMLPKFLTSQRTGEPRRLIHNLQMLVDAIEAYQANHGGVPAAIVTPMDNVLQVQRPVYSNASRNIYFQHIEKPYQFFHDNGYLDRMPDFDVVDDFMESELQYYAGISMPMWIELYGQSIQSIAGIQKLENYYCSLFWFKAEINDITIFIKYLNENQNSNRFILSPHDRFETDGYWMKPEYFYSPSNGLYSTGFLYVDSAGRHSPWE
jgi:hypothetical protein